MMYACPCCKFMTRSSVAFGTFEICEVCFWEDDSSQADEPTLHGGANSVSLEEACENYQAFGAAEKRFVHLVRAPVSDEYP